MAAELGLTRPRCRGSGERSGCSRTAETFKLSTDPLFVEKVRDIVGLYLDPPERASCSASTRRARSRRSIAPRRSCRCCRAPRARTHDYKRARHDQPVRRARRRDRQGDRRAARSATARSSSRSSCASIDREVPDDLEVHLILDNYATHKTPAIQSWLAAPPALRLALHPDLGVVAEPRRALVRRAHRRKPRRGTHRTVAALNTDIRAWITTWNENPRPYVWVKTADQILDNLTQYLNRINDSRH